MTVFVLLVALTGRVQAGAWRDASDLLSISTRDGRFHIRDRVIVPGPLTIIGRGENDEGPLIGFLTLTTIDGGSRSCAKDSHRSGCPTM